MKVIDLLNKIAKGEEVPKNIKYSDYILTYDVYTQDYYNELSCTYSLFNDIHYKLNDKIEIIEDTPKEDKKIRTIDCWYSMDDIKNHPELHNIMFEELKDKINEIIDKVNGE